MMEAVSLAGVLWAFVLVLPAVLATALCIGCRDTGSPAHSAQAVGDYEYKPPPCVPPNSFMVLTRANYPSRNQIKQQPVAPAEQFLSIPVSPAASPCLPLSRSPRETGRPSASCCRHSRVAVGLAPARPSGSPARSRRSPQAPQSRQVSFSRTETDDDSVPSYENEERPRGDDDDNDYNNELYVTGYVEVLPDSVTETAPAEQITPGPELRDSASSVAMGDEYENVPEAQRESLADSLEYVNMPEPGASLPDAHYGASDRESEDDGPDYENLHR